MNERTCPAQQTNDRNPEPRDSAVPKSGYEGPSGKFGMSCSDQLANFFGLFVVA